VSPFPLSEFELCCTVEAEPLILDDTVGCSAAGASVAGVTVGTGVMLSPLAELGTWCAFPSSWLPLAEMDCCKD